MALALGPAGSVRRERSRLEPESSSRTFHLHTPNSATFRCSAGGAGVFRRLKCGAAIQINSAGEGACAARLGELSAVAETVRFRCRPSGGPQGGDRSGLARGAVLGTRDPVPLLW